MIKPIYLDYNATVPILEEVKKSLIDCMDVGPLNPSSVHYYGRKGKEIIDVAKTNIGELVNTNKNNIIFTSSIGAIDRSKNDNCDKPLDLKASANPSSYYGYSKLVGEKLIRKFSKNNVILRICWCYGKYMTSDTHMKFLFESTKKNKL